MCKGCVQTMDRCHKFDITFTRQLSIWGSTFKIMVGMSIVAQNSEELVIITSCSFFCAFMNERGRRLCERVLDYNRRRQDAVILDSRLRYCQHLVQKRLTSSDKIIPISNSSSSRCQCFSKAEIHVQNTFNICCKTKLPSLEQKLCLLLDAWNFIPSDFLL